MLSREEENEADVRREDQENINKFARLNARLHEVRQEKDAQKKELERLEDASMEIMMQDDNVMLLMGEAFLEVSEENATEFVDKKVEEGQATVDRLEVEEAEIVQEQDSLKKILYGRFGSSIQLEEK